jgi:hypothetical protein
MSSGLDSVILPNKTGNKHPRTVATYLQGNWGTIIRNDGVACSSHAGGTIPFRADRAERNAKPARATASSGGRGRRKLRLLKKIDPWAFECQGLIGRTSVSAV